MATYAITLMWFELAVEPPDTEAGEILPHFSVPMVRLFPEGVWFVYALAMELDALYQALMRTRLGVTLRESPLTRLNALCFVLSIGLRIASVALQLNGFSAAAVTAYRAFQALLSLGSVVVCLGILNFLSHWRALGVLHIMFSSMMSNIGPWLTLWLTFVFGFCVAFLGLDAGGFHRSADSFFQHKHQLLRTNGEDRSQFEELWRAFAPFSDEGQLPKEGFEGAAIFPAFLVPFWSTFGVINEANYDLVASLFLYVFMCFSNIVLVNLLIACFADEYAKIGHAADIEFAHMRCKRPLAMPSYISRLPLCLSPPLSHTLSLYLPPLSSLQIGTFSATLASRRRFLRHSTCPTCCLYLLSICGIVSATARRRRVHVFANADVIAPPQLTPPLV